MQDNASMTDADFIASAEAAPVWREMVASFAVSGIDIKYDNELMAGQLIAGDIDVNKAARRCIRR